MKAKNINGRRQSSCKCGTWLDHWAKMCGLPLPRHCSEARCMGKPELGAHVQKESATDNNWYIIPLCVKHSIKAEHIEIAETTIFVSAQVGDTCAKQLPIGNVRPQELRETLLTSALKHGTDVAKVQDWLDHAHSSTPRLCAKRKDRQQEFLPLWRMY